MRISLVIAMFFGFSGFLAAQSSSDLRPLHDATTPTWARLMYADNPNVREVDGAFQAYYRQHPFEKNAHTQYYKRWRRQVDAYVQADGHIARPEIASQQAAEQQYLQQRQEATAKNLTPPWTCIGPFDTYNTENNQIRVSWQANVYCIDQSPSHPDIVYCGTESGGIFKTTDKGLNWQPASHQTLMTTVRAIKVHPSNPDIVYAGDGRKVYKTLDGGANWAVLLDQSSLDVNDIAIRPDSTDVILLAGGKGLYRSVDGGANWTQLYTQVCWDIEIKPDDPQVVYILKSNSTAKRSEFFKSTDGGATFSIRENGWYSSDNADRREDGARMTVTPADPNVVYVVLIGNSKPGDNGFIGIYRSNDAGESWLLPNQPVGGPYTSSHPNLMTLNNTNSLYQGYYNLGIAASHANADHLLIGGLNLWRSTDGAQTFTPLGGYQGNVGWIHPDQQEIEINGDDQWVVNDGGINYSSDLFANHESRKYGLTASDFWGFGSGWNEDLLVGGRYHNGNTAYRPSFEEGRFLRLGGAEAATGYVSPGEAQTSYFSDISSKLIPYELSGDVINAPSLSLYPNESYYAAHSSELEFHPNCYNTIYIGRENKLWRSDDGGQRYDLVKEFGGDPDAPLLHFDIARSNPQVIYVYQRSSFYGATLWRSADGGANWEEKTFPAANSQRAGTMTLSAEDENTLWVTFSHQNNDGAKIFKTTDGGDNWENLTTPVLDGQATRYVFHQSGTDGLVYLATNFAVYYRDDTMSDWELYSEGLPYKAEANIIRPFYKEGKLRMATYGHGVWETEMAAASRPLAQPTVDKFISYCIRDTFYFDDYSVLHHNGASWEWEFPGAAYVSDYNARNPKVTYDTPGTYDVTLRITDGNGNTSEKSISGMVTVTNGCDPETIPGFALKCESPGDYAQTPVFGQTVDALTISAWVKPDGIQPEYTGIVMNELPAGFNFKTNNRLGYHWPGGGQWWWDSGLAAPPGEWSHVAFVYNGQSITIYVNGIASTQNINLPPVLLSAFKIGSYNGWNDRNYKGLIDEVCIWDRALSQDEIRLLRHLTKIPATDPNLIAYYQFNETDGYVLDRSGTRHASLRSGAIRETCTAPVGGGVAAGLDIEGEGNYEFPGTGISISAGTGLTPNGQVIATRINLAPDASPDFGGLSPAYWVINNYGTNDVFDGITAVEFDSIGDISAAQAQQPEAFLLFQRSDNADGDTWEIIGQAHDAIQGTPGSAAFGAEGEIYRFGQFIVARDTAVFTSVPSVEYLPAAFIVYPNPGTAGGNLFIRTESEEAYVFTLYDSQGRQVWKGSLRGSSAVALPGLAAGVYGYSIETPTRMYRGKWITE
jgi:photosystem II stability/assembly factor-like uncharacterized protein/PKD repeat protein